MVGIPIAVINRYFNLSAVLKFAQNSLRLKMNQNKPKRSIVTHNQQQFTAKFSLPCLQSGRF